MLNQLSAAAFGKIQFQSTVLYAQNLSSLGLCSDLSFLGHRRGMMRELWMMAWLCSAARASLNTTVLMTISSLILITEVQLLGYQMICEIGYWKSM